MRKRSCQRWVVAVAALAMSTAVASCSSGSSPASSGSGEQLTVFAAASLTKSFTQIGQEFQAAHPGTMVRFNFAGSSDLVSQLQQGAPADVFASADETTMAKVVAADLVSGTPAPFATNSMAIAVPPGNPAHIQEFADLAGPGLQVVVCAPQVPCGAATVAVEKKTRTTLKPVSEEPSVTDVLGKVASGEADAGVVYVTDVTGAGGKVDGVTIPAKDNAVNTYPVAVLAGSAAPQAAAEFQAWVLGPQGRRVLAEAGFGAS